MGRLGAIIIPKAVSKSFMRLGLFDSGIGGLTVLRAIRNAYPALDMVYLGDTARVPYGIKSPRSIERYAQQAVQCLVETADVSAVVIACNTASALATTPLRAQFDGLPIVSVIEPGALEAVRAVTKTNASKHIGVLATESTVRGGAYQRAIQAVDETFTVTSQASQLLVALAEEGWVDGSVAALVLERYLTALHAQAGSWPTAIVLGCTHFPLLKPAIQQVAKRLVQNSEPIEIIDSSEAVAAQLPQMLGNFSAQGHGSTRFMATDGAQRFANVGSRFLGYDIDQQDVEIIDLHLVESNF